MIYCLDTDILIEYFRGNEPIKRKIESLPEEDSVSFTWLTFYEFFKGIFVSGKLEEESFLQGLAKTCIGNLYGSPDHPSRDIFNFYLHIV